MKNATELVFILDRSGSMRGLEDDTIGGFNAFVDKQKALKSEVHISTILFNHQVQLLHDRIDLSAVLPLTSKDYEVGGSTALLDAIGYGIDKIVSVQKSMTAKHQAQKVLFVVMTDGHENASRQYSAQDIKKMIEHQEQRYGWEFIFMGANIDALSTSREYGFRKERSTNFKADAKGMLMNFKSIDKMVSDFRQDKEIKADWNEEIEAYLNKKGK
jgi:uncharacterized protein YegL